MNIIEINESTRIDYKSGKLEVYMNGALWFSMDDQKAERLIKEGEEDSNIFINSLNIKEKRP